MSVFKTWDEAIAERFPEWDEQVKRKDSVLKKLPNNIKRDWNNSSLLTVDNFLKTNSKTILCADLSFMYYKFWYDLKRIKSNSMNFMGYSEFLITRLMLHLLEAKHCPYNNGITYSTVNRASPNSDIGNFRVGKQIVMATECIPEELWKEMGKLRKR